MSVPITLHRREQMKWRNEHAANQGWKCTRCRVKMRGRGEREPTLDHIIPLAKGGDDSFENTQTLCRKCNELKADKLE